MLLRYPYPGVGWTEHSNILFLYSCVRVCLLAGTLLSLSSAGRRLGRPSGSSLTVELKPEGRRS